ncbi:MAG: heme b synthase [Promethearchaeota archaeon]
MTEASGVSTVKFSELEAADPLDALRLLPTSSPMERLAGKSRGCLAVPDAAFEEELERLRRSFSGVEDRDIPNASRLITQLHLLDSCNLRCAHCYVGDARFKPRPPLTLEEAKRRVDLLKAFQETRGFPQHTMNLSGGEPTTHARLLDVVRHVVARDVKPLLLSNGLALTGQFAAKVRDAGCTQVQVSLEGTRRANDAIRGPGVYDAALRAVDALQHAGIVVVVGVTISRLNLGELPDLWTALDGKVDRFHMREVTPIGAATGFEPLNAPERWALYRAIRRWDGETRLFLEDPPYCTCDPSLVERRAGCAAATCLLCVDTDGTVFPCRKAPFALGTIDDLEAAWNHPAAARMRQRSYDGPCGSCPVKGACGGCRGYAMAVTGNVLGSDDRCFLQTR